MSGIGATKNDTDCVDWSDDGRFPIHAILTSGVTTRATQVLQRAKVPFDCHEYRYDSQPGDIGLHAAHCLGVEPARLLKTLIVLIDDRPAVALVPCDRHLDMKQLAQAASAKRCRMAEADLAERLSGYVIGGISPLGMKKRVPVYVETMVMSFSKLLFNGGRSGLQLEVDSMALLQVLDAKAAAISRYS